MILFENHKVCAWEAPAGVKIHLKDGHVHNFTALNKLCNWYPKDTKFHPLDQPQFLLPKEMTREQLNVLIALFGYVFVESI